ncbi:chondrolectin [Salmo salar]|uniref:Chondrolectin n=1 Tax=Salmo salar TaxID=8030 RepID=A0ABM3DCI9_SALSA|nr:chondrolectin-like [Salmo salar]
MVSKGSKVWIGLFRDSWKWSDGSDSSFRHWKPTQPNNNGGVQSCGAAVYKEGQSWTDRWFDWNCNDRHPFVCSSVKKTQQVVRVKLTPKDQNMVLTDIVVQEAILQQIKKELRGKGMPDDIKLIWKEQLNEKIFHKEENKDSQKKERKDVMTKLEF